jgi:hypothetical protein
MQPPLGTYNATTQLIESAPLTPTEHLIWKAFLDEAVDREYAAHYIWNKIHDHSGPPTEQILRELKLEWKQVVTKCPSKMRT